MNNYNAFSFPETRTALEALRQELVSIIDSRLIGIAQSASRGSKAATSKDDELMTQREVCRFLHLTKPTIIDYEKRGLLRVLRIGRRVYYKCSDIMRSLESSSTARKETP